MNAEILSIGSEIVTGRIADTNAAWLSERLIALGIPVTRHTALDDCFEDIVAAIADIAGRADAAMVTGGIGPTPDDLTRQAFACAGRRELVEVPGALENIRAIFARRGREVSPSNLVQARIPDGARWLPNPRGTAAGFAMVVGSCEFFVLPGVPSEMKRMYEESVAPVLAGRGGQVILIRSLQTFDMGESVIGERLGELMDEGRNPDVATQARDGVITVRATAFGSDRAETEALLDRTVREIRARLGDAVFAEGETGLAETVAVLLSARRKTLALAESCTAGEIAARLADVPGISASLLEGVVAYSNDAKVRRLGVPRDLIERQGAVSAEVAERMAVGIRETSGSDIGLGVTGVAGPSGGTAEKPVGLVYLALADASGVTARALRLHGDRNTIRDRAAKYALNLIRLHLEGREKADG